MLTNHGGNLILYLRSSN